MEGRRLARYRPKVDDSERMPWRWHTDANNDGNGQTAGPRSDAAIRGGGSANSHARTLRNGDRIAINLRGIPDPEEIQDIIDDRGYVNLPLIGEIKLAGMATSVAEKMIERAYVKGGYYRKINVTVVTQDGEYFVRGEVKAVGRYPLSGDLTLLQAITAAGGYTDFAKITKIKIIRGKEVLVFDGKRIEQRKDTDPLVKPDDIVIIPRRLY
jgi:polysaccharide export outer membrane protein